MCWWGCHWQWIFKFCYIFVREHLLWLWHFSFETYSSLTVFPFVFIPPPKNDCICFISLHWRKSNKIVSAFSSSWSVYALRCLQTHNEHIHGNVSKQTDNIGSSAFAPKQTNMKLCQNAKMYEENITTRNIFLQQTKNTQLWFYRVEWTNEKEKKNKRNKTQCNWSLATIPLTKVLALKIVHFRCYGQNLYIFLWYVGLSHF